MILLGRMLAWRAALPVLKWALPLPRLVRLMAAPQAVDGRRPDRERAVAALAHGLSGPRGVAALDNCLERSLVLYRYLGRSGARPELVVGVGKRDESVAGHVWVLLDGEALYETPASLSEFAPIVSFDAEGRSLSA
ncbi:MAG: Transglutaminase-like superfamily [Thermoleophilaceae bacterium]|nr:Transglutaminase-like superfamily [Thermoleophilaceae bacterium]